MVTNFKDSANYIDVAHSKTFKFSFLIEIQLIIVPILLNG